MRSATTSAAAPDLTARARILDAAIERFAADGVAATTVRAIAVEAGVSPALVIHHFGSKDALRAACDEHVAATIRDQKQAAVAAGPNLDPLAALRGAGDYQPMLRYLARTLVDGSPQVVALVDEMVEDAVAYLQLGVETGLLRPSDDPRARAIVLVLWSLGGLVLHEHFGRLLGADLTAADPSGFAPYVVPASEILGHGVFAEGVHERIAAAFAEEEGIR